MKAGLGWPCGEGDGAREVEEERVRHVEAFIVAEWRGEDLIPLAESYKDHEGIGGVHLARGGHW